MKQNQTKSLELVKEFLQNIWKIDSSQFDVIWFAIIFYSFYYFFYLSMDL